MIRRPASETIQFKARLKEKIEIFRTGYDFEDPDYDEEDRIIRVDVRCGAFGFYPGDVIKVEHPAEILLSKSPQKLYLVIGMDVDDNACLVIAPVKTYIVDGIEKMTACRCYYDCLYPDDIYESCPSNYVVEEQGLRVYSDIRIVYRFGAAYLDDMRQYPMDKVIEYLTEYGDPGMYHVIEA